MHLDKLKTPLGKQLFSGIQNPSLDGFTVALANINSSVMYP